MPRYTTPFVVPCFADRLLNWPKWCDITYVKDLRAFLSISQIHVRLKQLLGIRSEIYRKKSLTFQCIMLVYWRYIVWSSGYGILYCCWKLGKDFKEKVQKVLAFAKSYYNYESYFI